MPIRTIDVMHPGRDRRMLVPINNMLQNEPLLGKDICKAMNYFKEKDGDRVPVSIVTNGYPLTSSLIKRKVFCRDYKSIEACKGCSVIEYFESWV